MTPVSLTLNFQSLADLQAYLNRTEGTVLGVTKTIALADRPDAGAIADEKTVVVEPFVLSQGQQSGVVLFNPFAAGGAAVPLPPAPAPFTAAVGALPIAPAAPTSTAVVPVPPVPVPPPASAAAAPAVPAAPTNPAGIEVDADGLPWDARIHASGKDGKPKNADGRWRQKRGLNDGALKARVEAELRQAMNAPAAPPASVPVPLPPTPPAPPAATSPVPTAATPATPAAPLPASPASAPASDATAFPAFMARVGGLMVAGSLSQQGLTAALVSVGLTSPVQLGTRPDLLPAVEAHINAQLAPA